MVTGLFAIALLIAANAAFVAAEFGLLTVNRARLEAMSSAGNRRARNVLESVRHLSFHLSGAQFGITWSSLAVGAIIEPTIGRPLSDLMGRLPIIPQASALEISLALALAVATAVQMVVGELIPKNVAIALPLRTAFVFTPPLRLHNGLLRPLISFLNGSANASLRLVGIEPRDELEGIRSLGELDLLIQSSFKEGAVDEESFELLSGSIRFFSKKVRDVMVPRIETVGISSSQTLRELTSLHAETGHSRFPVFTQDLDDASHVIHVKDVLRFKPSKRASTRVSSIMRQGLTILESARLRPLLGQMRSSGIHMALVTDEYGSLAGIVTLDDILDEIVGDLSGRADDVSHGSDGFTVPGDLPLRELEEQTGLRLPEGKYATVAGFVLDAAGKIPTPGEKIPHRGWLLEIIDASQRRVERIKVIPPSQEPR